MVSSGVYQKFRHSISKLGFKGDGHSVNRIAIALSGGVDSVALLDLLVKFKAQNPKLRLQIHAITIDHNLREASFTETQKLNASVIKEKQYPIIHSIMRIEKGTINLNKLEMDARNMRYDLIYRYCSTNRIEHIFMGHHLDDQLETFVMRLQSNSTIFGLYGMRFQTASNLFNFNRINLIRPLLGVTKREIYDYASSNNLSWFEDHTNNDHTLTQRNLIRKILNDEQYKDIRTGLVDSHAKVVQIIDSLEKRIDDVESYNMIERCFEYDKETLSLKVGLQYDLDHGKYLNEIDHLVLNRWLFNKVWLVSPSKNYFYGFTKFDSSTSAVTTMGAKSCLSHDLLQTEKGKRTLLNCVVEWSSKVHQNRRTISVRIYREPNHSCVQRESYPLDMQHLPSTPVLFDNRTFLTFKAAPTTRCCVMQIENFHLDKSNYNLRFSQVAQLLQDNGLGDGKEEVKKFIQKLKKYNVPVITIKNVNAINVSGKEGIDTVESNLGDIIAMVPSMHLSRKLENLSNMRVECNPKRMI